MRQFKTFPVIGLLALGALLLPTGAMAGSVFQSSLHVGGLLGSPNSVNVQTSIDATKNIGISSSISVVNAPDGYQVDYGVNGASVLNVIDQTDSAAANSDAQRTAYATALENAALAAVQQ